MDHHQARFLLSAIHQAVQVRVDAIDGVLLEKVTESNLIAVAAVVVIVTIALRVARAATMIAL